MTTDRGFVSLADGGRLAYERTSGADGLPLLLLRPLGGSMALWGRFAAQLSETRAIVAFDPRGVGASSDPPWRHTTRDMAADALALADALSLDRFDVLGLSLGGMVASWLAVDAASRVSRLVLASTLPRATKVSRRVRDEALPMARALLQPGIEAEVALVREILSPEFRRDHPDRVREIEATVRAHPTRRRNLLALALAAARHDIGNALGTIDAPTLVLVGERDPIVGKRADAELLHGISGAVLSVVASSGHDVSLEQPDAAASQVSQFLAG
jgi:3-oxoadipate enol-lactonase